VCVCVLLLYGCFFLLLNGVPVTHCDTQQDADNKAMAVISKIYRVAVSACFTYERKMSQLHTTTIGQIVTEGSDCLLLSRD
jgi:hypothetical protein